MFPRRPIMWIAWRSLTVGSRRRGLGFMTLVSIAVVALGITALVVVLSVMGGLEREMKRRMLQGHPHVEITNKPVNQGISLREQPIEGIRAMLASQITAIEPYIEVDVVAQKRRHLASMVLFGLGGEEQVWGFADAMIEGNFQSLWETHSTTDATSVPVSRPGIILGEELAGQLAANIGDGITVFSPQATSSQVVLTGGTLSQTFVLVGLFRTGLYDYDSKYALVNMAQGRRFMQDYDPYLDIYQYVTGLAVLMEDPFTAESFKGKMLKKFPHYRFVTWQDNNAALLFALKLEKVTMGSILMLIVLVSAFSISGTMMMTVYYKQYQISVLRAIGISRWDLGLLFVVQGSFIGFIGILLGLTVGLAICGILAWTDVIQLGSYSIPDLPVKFLPVEYAALCFFAWALSIIGALYPALVAANQNPSSGLRC